MNQYYREDKEAKDALVKMDKTPKEFCPLTKEMCRIDCICYIEAHTIKTFIEAKSKYRIVKGYCSNEMFEKGD